MESAHEAHTVPHELQATWKVAHEPAQKRVRRPTAASVSTNTRRAYEGALHHLRDWLTGHPLDDASLAEYLATRLGAGHSSAAVSQVVAAGIAVGGAQTLATATALIVEMQSAGQWPSPSIPHRFARGQLTAHGPPPKLRSGL